MPSATLPFDTIICRMVAEPGKTLVFMPPLTEHELTILPRNQQWFQSPMIWWWTLKLYSNYERETTRFGYQSSIAQPKCQVDLLILIKRKGTMVGSSWVLWKRPQWDFSTKHFGHESTMESTDSTLIEGVRHNQSCFVQCLPTFGWEGV